VLAGQRYGIPLSGTMAHSFVQSFDREHDAFRAYADLYPHTTLLVDTFDTLEGVHKVIELAREMGPAFNVGAVRLDSGNLLALSLQTRAQLDAAGLTSVQIFASGGLDEFDIQQLLERAAPVDGFGVGTRLAVSQDAPALDIAYKLTTYAGRDRFKLSTDKQSLPGQKQVFRSEQNGLASGDVIARHDESLPGRPLLSRVMRNGVRVAQRRPLNELREKTRAQIAGLPAHLRALDPAAPPYEVRLSEELKDARNR
jgi:nicotinate phosphoribosyltransferase